MLSVVKSFASPLKGISLRGECGYGGKNGGGDKNCAIFLFPRQQIAEFVDVRLAARIDREELPTVFVVSTAAGSFDCAGSFPRE